MIVQTWESAHAEAAAMLLCVLAAALLVRRRDGWAGIALGLAVAFKVTPLGLLVPALLGGRASPARFLAGFAPAFLLPYVPYLVTGGSFGSLFQSGTGWTGGSLALHAARPAHHARARPLAGARALHRRRGVDRRQLPRSRADRGGVRLDLHPARPVPAGGPRVVLAHAAGAGTRRRPVAAAPHRAWSRRSSSRCRWRPSWRGSAAELGAVVVGRAGSGAVLAGPGPRLSKRSTGSPGGDRHASAAVPGRAVAILRR